MQETGKTAAVLLCLAVAAIMIAAGCTASSGTGNAAPGSAGTVTPAEPVAPNSGSLVIKNNGPGEIHAWIASDQAAWAGDANNEIGPGKDSTLAYAVAGSPGTAAPVYACVGRSEKVLECTALPPASGVLVWDGTALAPGS